MKPFSNSAIKFFIKFAKIRKKHLSVLILLLLTFCISFTFSMGGKIQIVPMKTNTAIDIPDGEFLHYGYYNGGEKVSDSYQVTRKATNGNGGFFYRIYMDFIPVSSGRKFPENYKNSPVSVLIDPVRGQTLESEGNLNTNEYTGKKDIRNTFQNH